MPCSYPTEMKTKIFKHKILGKTAKKKRNLFFLKNLYMYSNLKALKG